MTVMGYGLRMKRLILLISVVSFGAWVSAEEDVQNILAENIAGLPIRVSNNAVTTIDVEDRQFVVSFAGLGSGRAHSDTPRSQGISLLIQAHDGFEWGACVLPLKSCSKSQQAQRL